MKVAVILVLVAVALCGCGDTHAREHAHAEPTPAATYKEGRGVHLTETGKAFVGLKTAEVVAGSSADAGILIVPSDALLRTVRGDFVYVVNGDWFLRTPVQVGEISGGRIEIKDGLYDGDTVVTQGVRALSLSEIHALNGGVGCADGH